MATSKIKKHVLGLGGSDPFIVYEMQILRKRHLVLSKAALIAVQICMASKRFIVVMKTANEFIEKFAQKFEKLQVGNPIS